MPNVFGDQHKLLNDMNRIGERGIEGYPTKVAEKFQIPANTAFAVADMLDSDILRVPKDAILTNIRIIKTVAPVFMVQYVDNDDAGAERRRDIVATGAAGMADLQIRNGFVLRPPFYAIHDRDFRIALHPNAAIAGNAIGTAGVIVVELTYLNL